MAALAVAACAAAATAAERSLPADRLPQPTPPRAPASAGGPERVRIDVARDGVQRLTLAALAPSGVDFAGAPLDELRLTSRGRADASREIPLLVTDADGDGLLGPADRLTFFGEALVGEERDGFFQRANHSDVNAYFLDLAPGRRLRMATADARPNPASPLLADFLATARLERDEVFLGNHRTGLQGVDHFYSCPSLLTRGGSSARTESVPLPGLATGSARPAAVRVRLLSRTSDAASPDHLSEVALNGAVVSQRQADGYAIVDHAAAISAAALSDPAAVTARLPGILAGPERAELDWVEIDYPRSFAAAAGELDFRVTGPARAVVGGLPAGGVVALDVTDGAQPTLLTGIAPAGGSLALEVPPGERRIVVVADAASGLPPTVASSPSLDLDDPALAADLVVIAPEEWVVPKLPALQRYEDWRRSQGVRVLTLSFRQVVDAANDGQFSPFATSRLLARAAAAWVSPPRWCLLLGDANVDHRDALGGRSLLPSDCSELPDACGRHETGWAQMVPTHVVDAPEDQTFLGYFASDSILGMVADGDWMPDVAIGRLPARTAGEAEAMLDKIVAYEQRPAQPWATRFMTVADQVAPGQETIETSQDLAAASVPACYARDVMYYQRDWQASDQPGFTTELVARWTDPARGAAVVSYVGHGNTFNWSTQALLTNDGPSCRDDVPALSVPGAPEPVVVNADCVAAGFMHLVGPSLLEELVRAPQGGAIAAYGPTGITDLAYAEPIITSFYEGVYGPDARGGRLGDAILHVQSVLAEYAAAGSPDELLGNVLLGDPSLLLAIPFAPPAGGLRATALDGAVRLDWDAVPGADSYDAWRFDGSSWTRAVSAIVGTTWTDTGLVNGRDVTHAIEPHAGCLPGRWSANATTRPCAPATRPEPVTSVQVVSQDCSGDVLLTWTASPSPSVVANVVRAHRGTTAAPPELTVETVGTFARLPLVAFRDYEITVSAKDGCGAESDPSAPVAAAPRCAIVADGPRMIDDLRVRRVGADLVFAWSPVTQTIQGAPLSPSAYAIDRAPSPDFDAASAVVARVPGTSWTDAARVGNGIPLELFAVAAEDASGRRGPVGHDLPQGVSGYRREDADASTYRLTWEPVLFDVRGEVTPVDRYEVFASTAPLTRAAVDSMAPAVVVSGTTCLVPSALGPYHLIVAVDVHGNRSAF